MNEKYKGQRAISYQRASLGKGYGQDDSTDRQSDTAIEYCEQMGMELDLSYRILDEGVSAYKQVSYVDEQGIQRQGAKNLVKGALAQFVENVQSGAFPNGINLIVEKLDRIYRDDPMDAMGHFLALLREGVTIHTMIDRQVYSRDSENKQVTMMMSIMYLVASHQYSKDLGERIRRAQDRRIKNMQENGTFEPIGKLHEWISYRVEENGDKIPYVKDKDREIIKTLFDLYLGGLTASKVARTLNAKKVFNFRGQPWENWKVLDVLESRSVIGKYTPKDGVEIHFDELQVIKDEIFYECSKRKKSKYQQGKHSQHGNALQDIIKCGYCLTEKKVLKDKPFLPSTLWYAPPTVTRRDIMPQKYRRPYHGYRCNTGRTNFADCSGGRIDYYDVEDVFFSFVKELDFSKIINPEKKIDNRIHVSKITTLRAKISQIDVELENAMKMASKVKNETLIENLAKQMDELQEDKDTLLQQIEDEKMLMSNLQRTKKQFIANEQNVKKLLETATTSNEHDAYLFQLVDLWDKNDNRGKYKDSGLALTKEELVKRDELTELWELKGNIATARSEGKERKVLRFEKRSDELRKKYFSKEMEKDRMGYIYKMKLNSELKKFVKEVKVYPFGIPSVPATKISHYRGESLSCFDQHKEHLRDFILNLDEEQNKQLKENPVVVPNKNKGNTEWRQYELKQLLGCKDSKTYRRWVARGMPDPMQGDTVESAIAWVKADRVTNPRNKINVAEGKTIKRFFSMTVEFTEVCKPDVIKYIIPYWKDKTSGVCFDYKKGDLELKWAGHFGKKTIKRYRTKSSKSKDKEKNVIYVDDDVWFSKAVDLAESAVTTDQMAEIFGEDLKEIDMKDLVDTKNLKPKKHYTFANYKKLRSNKAKFDFLFDAIVVLGRGNTYFKLVDEVIALGGKVAKEMEVHRDNMEEWFNTLAKKR